MLLLNRLCASDGPSELSPGAAFGGRLSSLPLVGRDILLGAVFAVAGMLVFFATSIVSGWLGHPPELNLNPGAVNIGTNLFIVKFTNQLSGGIFLGFMCLFLLLLFFVVLRRERLAFGLLWLLLTIVSALLAETPMQLLPLTALGTFIPVHVLYRYGLLASVATFFFTLLSIHYPYGVQRLSGCPLALGRRLCRCTPRRARRGRRRAR